jgi:hypothetical protein
MRHGCCTGSGESYGKVEVAVVVVAADGGVLVVFGEEVAVGLRVMR